MSIKKTGRIGVFSKYQEYRRNKIEHKYAGDNVTCVICGSRYSEFAAFGKKNRKNARCHNCNSLERHRLIWSYINRKELLKPGMSILHVAPEKVFYELLAMQYQSDYVPCDLNPQRFDFANTVPVIQADITQTLFKSNAFDLILCNHVLEHVPEDRKAMSELYRVMKKGGVGIFQVPVDYERESTYEDFSIQSKRGRTKAFGQYDHVRWYGKDYKDRLTNAGFTVKIDDFVNEFSKDEQFYFGYESGEKIYCCLKDHDMKG